MVLTSWIRNTGIYETLQIWIRNPEAMKVPYPCVLFTKRFNAKYVHRDTISVLILNLR
jgi:hypothetical protein